MLYIYTSMYIYTHMNEYICLYIYMCVCVYIYTYIMNMIDVAQLPWEVPTQTFLPRK